MPRRTELRLDAQATAALADAARARGVTVNTLVQMAWANILSTVHRPHRRGVRGDGVRTAGSNWPASSRWSACSSTPSRCGCGSTRRSGSARSAWRCSARPPPCAITATWHTPSCGRSPVSARCSTRCWSTRTSRRADWSARASSRPRARGSGPSALESLAHFPVTIAAHLTDGELTVLVEVIDGALGAMTPESARPTGAGHRAAADRLLGPAAARRRGPARWRGRDRGDRSLAAVSRGRCARPLRRGRRGPGRVRSH